MKVNGYTFRVSNSPIFIFIPRLNKGQFIKERICSSRIRLFSLRVDPLLAGLSSSRKQTGSHKSLFPFVKQVVKIEMSVYLEAVPGSLNLKKRVLHPNYQLKH